MLVCTSSKTASCCSCVQNKRSNMKACCPVLLFDVSCGQGACQLEVCVSQCCCNTMLVYLDGQLSMHHLLACPCTTTCTPSSRQLKHVAIRHAILRRPGTHKHLERKQTVPAHTQSSHVCAATPRPLWSLYLEEFILNVHIGVVCDNVMIHGECSLWMSGDITLRTPPQSRLVTVAK